MIKLYSLVYDDNVTLFTEIPEGDADLPGQSGGSAQDLRVNIKKMWSITIKVNEKAKFIVLVSSQLSVGSELVGALEVIRAAPLKSY